MTRLVPLFVLPLLLALVPAQDAPLQKGARADKTYRPGHAVRHAMELPDLDGRTVTLFPRELGDRGVAGGITTVLVFWSLRDPIARGYVKELESIQADHRKDRLVVYLVDSNNDEVSSVSTSLLAKLRTYVVDEGVELTILVDEGNVVADRFGAICSNHAFIVDADRYVRYAGGIDNDPGGKLARRGADVTHWLRDAILQTLKGEAVVPDNTRPTGRPIKRVPKPEKSAAGR
jgi:hypothetical protein